VIIPTVRSDCIAKKVVALGFAKRSYQFSSVKAISLANVEPLDGGKVSIVDREGFLENETKGPQKHSHNNA
jgi:hypothetical protein